MKVLPFNASHEGTLGIELEYQIIDPDSYDLTNKAKDLLHEINKGPYKKTFKPEITQSMIEINSSVHREPYTLIEELSNLRLYLKELGKKLNILFCGGGTHPFQKFELQKIYPTKRFKELSKEFGYLTKRSTVFGQHIHIGCKNAEDALYLTHALGRFVPQFIAMSASSPFLHELDTDFQSCRIHDFNSYPMSGFIPYLQNWQEFSNYFLKMQQLGIVESMKDVYWDVRPKPEFGTVEIRVFDTPLTIHRAVFIASYVQAVACFLLKNKPAVLCPNLYYLYNYNHFEACRYGYEGPFIDPNTLEKKTIYDDIINTIELLKNNTNSDVISKLSIEINKKNDASWLRETFKKTGSLQELVKTQCLLWEGHVEQE